MTQAKWHQVISKDDGYDYDDDDDDDHDENDDTFIK